MSATAARQTMSPAISRGARRQPLVSTASASPSSPRVLPRHGWRPPAWRPQPRLPPRRLPRAPCSTHARPARWSTSPRLPGCPASPRRWRAACTTCGWLTRRREQSSGRARAGATSRRCTTRRSRSSRPVAPPIDRSCSPPRARCSNRAHRSARAVRWCSWTSRSTRRSSARSSWRCSPGPRGWLACVPSDDRSALKALEELAAVVDVDRRSR